MSVYSRTSSDASGCALASSKDATRSGVYSIDVGRIASCASCALFEVL